jgi:hypothetical protein
MPDRQYATTSCIDTRPGVNDRYGPLAVLLLYVCGVQLPEILAKLHGSIFRPCHVPVVEYACSKARLSRQCILPK